MRERDREKGGKVSLYSNRTRQGGEGVHSTVQGGMAGWLLGVERLQVESDGGSRQNCHDSRSVLLVSSGSVAGKVEGGGQWVLIDLCSPV